MDGLTVGTYGIIGVLIWYLKTQTKRQNEREDKQDIERATRQAKYDKDQKEERDYNRRIVNKELRKNINLNVKGIILQKDMIKDFKEHNGHSEKFSEKVIETLGLICEKMNGDNSHDRRKKIKPVEVNRRK